MADSQPHTPSRARARADGRSARAAERQVKAEPDLSFGETAKRVGETWKGLSDAAKAPDVAKAEADARRHAREMASYQQGEKT